MPAAPCRGDPAAVAFDRQGIAGTLAGAKALPTTLFIDGWGTLRQMHMGQMSRVLLDIAVRELTGVRM